MRKDNQDIDHRTAVDSPCVGVCKIDPANRLCVGCARSIDEIGAWSRMAPADRRAVMATLAERRAAVTWSLDATDGTPLAGDAGQGRP